MSHRLLHMRRTLVLFVPLALIAAVLSFDSLSGQGDNGESVDVVAESLPILPSASVAVMGNRLLASPAIAPLVPGPCVASANGPVERAARTAPETVITVQNESCVGSTLTSVGRQQAPELDPATNVVIIGGIGLEFDWEKLAASCLTKETRSAIACQDDASEARANAANSFFSWRSLLQQTHRRAPDATIVVVAPPMPVSSNALALGSGCCGDSVDGYGQVLAVFDTAGSLRRAVIESVPSLPIVLVDSDEAFAGHRLDDAESWLNATPLLIGSPTAAGANAIAELLEVVMPVGALPDAQPLRPAEIALVLGTTTADEAGHESIQEDADSWFAGFVDAALEPSVGVVPIVTTDPVPPPTTTIAPTTTVPDDDPVGDDSAPVEIPIDDEPAEDQPDVAPRVDQPVDDQPVVNVRADRGLQADEPVVPAALEPSYAASGAELDTAIGELALTPGVTSVSDLIAALRDANSVLTPRAADQQIPHQQILVRAKTLDLANASVDDVLRLREELTRIDAEVTIMATASQSQDLSDLLANSSAIIARVSDSELGQALPTPAPTPVLVDLSIADSVAFSAQDPHVAANVTVSRVASAAITWSADGTVIAAGQRTTLPVSTLGVGIHEITVDVQSEPEVLTTTFMIDVSADGDGVTNDSCGNDFDPFATDIDDDGLAQACDDDDDGDGLPDGIDPCPSVSTDNLSDFDLDRIPDRCDPDQTDGPRADADGDGFADLIDNCPSVHQESQADADHDGIGNACENTQRTKCTIVGTAGDDNLRGTAGDDIICGLGGNDRINGLGGNDLILAGPGNDVVFGGADNDRIYGGNGADELHGSGGDDVILGEAGNDTLDGGFGLDVIFGGRGTDVVDGGEGPDIIFGGRGNDTLRGGRGADTIAGGLGHDTIFGEDGADVLTGDSGQDTVRAGRGNDMIIDVETVDFVRGGSGDDLIGAEPLRRT